MRRRHRGGPLLTAVLIGTGAGLAARDNAFAHIHIHIHLPKTPAAATLTTHQGTPSRATVAVAYARSKVGDWYEWGATGPTTYDCSGLTYMAWGNAGVDIGRTSQNQWASPHVQHIGEDQLQPGDLIFYEGYLEPGELPPGHVAMYIGGGLMVEAYATGTQIRITPVRPGAWGFGRPGGGS